MKRGFLILALAFLSSCDSSPFGDTKISSCDHSPDFKTGLPANCQVNFKNTENLSVWLDANDNGTITVPNQTDVESWSDKSGNSALFQTSSNFSVLVQKQVNSRAAVKWTSTAAAYSSTALTTFSADQNFTIAATFRIPIFEFEKFRLDNGAGNGLEIYVDSTGALNYKLSTGAAPVKSFIFSGDVSKFILSFNSSTKELFIYDDSSLVSTNQISGNTDAWGLLRLSGVIDLEINELLIYNSFKSETDVIEIQTYLNNKWGF